VERAGEAEAEAGLDKVLPMVAATWALPSNLATVTFDFSSAAKVELVNRTNAVSAIMLLILSPSR
jgi:hypothetical protein